jgi:hypothetical protein
MERRRIQERAHSVKAINPIELIPVSYGRASAQQSRLPPFQFKLAVDSVPVETPKKVCLPLLSLRTNTQIFQPHHH